MRVSMLVLVLAGLFIAVPAAAVDRVVDNAGGPCVSGVPIHATINGAIAAASPRETILVCAGDYTENVVVNKADVTLRGQGVVRLRPGNTGSHGITVTADGVTIQGFDISGTKEHPACALHVMADRSSIHDNHTHGNRWAICLDGGTDHRVRYNVTENNGVGILNLSSFGPVELSNNTVRNNIFGLYVQNCAPGATVHHNALTGNTVGILVGPAEFQPCDGVVITSNTVRGPGALIDSSGIDVHDSEDVVISRNLVEDTRFGMILREATGATRQLQQHQLQRRGARPLFHDGHDGDEEQRVAQHHGGLPRGPIQRWGERADGQQLRHAATGRRVRLIDPVAGGRRCDGGTGVPRGRKVEPLT